MSDGVPPLGGAERGRGVKNKPFLALNVHIWKTVGDKFKVTVNDY